MCFELLKNMQILLRLHVGVTYYLSIGDPFKGWMGSPPLTWPL
ncbi:hypothetical protein AM1_4218 [Acaryochloris marina MBIC11017]|uniref:Uncharacterized protein n=1 Tax=Acaryochloris marina (strain MBIC 11017) TaxID=329726 RepID=B0CCN6_ACAM1|nr:hypothetical protein AM1_4218 [Acaryochloris marina MBIC11017]